MTGVQTCALPIWIKDYISELYTTFSNIKEFEKLENRYKMYLQTLGVSAFIYPFIIKGYKYLKDDSEKVNELLSILEFIMFRAKLINSKAKIQERFNQILKTFEGDTIRLKKELRIVLKNSWYWTDEKLEESLKVKNAFISKDITSYILWRYEESLQRKGYILKKNFFIENEQLEHISPRTPTNGDKIENGYEIINGQYSEKFIDEDLNCIGNLMLISGSHNASIGNKPFKEKLESYNNPLLKQQAEIKEFVEIEDGIPIWNSISINERYKMIVNFAIETWKLEEEEIDS